MARLSLYLVGVAGLVAAWATYRERAYRTRRIPVKQAAALLSEAWADHHTRA